MTFLQELAISPILLGNSMKNLLQSKPFSWKQLAVSPFGQTLFVECGSHSSMPCRAECLPYTFNTAGIHDIEFLDTQFSSNCHLYICSPLALIIRNVIKNMLRKCCMIFSGSFEVMAHFVPFSLDQPIYLYDCTFLETMV